MASLTIAATTADAASSPPIQALLALGGSVLVALITVAGVIVAANRNARAMIAAEADRHAHAVEREERAWRRQAMADAYFRVIEAASRAHVAVKTVRWYLRPLEGMVRYKATYPDGVEEQVRIWNQASTDLRLAAAAVASVGDPAIAEYAEAFLERARAALEVSHAAGRSAKRADAYDVEAVAASELQDCEGLKGLMTRRIRASLGAEHLGDSREEPLALPSIP